MQVDPVEERPRDPGPVPLDLRRGKTGAKVVTDLYIEGTSAADGPAPTYFAMLDHDAEAIADALK